MKPLAKFILIRAVLLTIAVLLTLLTYTCAAYAYSPADHYDQVVADFHAEVRAKLVLTEDDIVRLVQMACYYHGIPGNEWAWLEEVIPRVTYRESRWDSKAANATSSARGIAQFLAAWGDESKRLDAVWSVYRMVEVYKDGGKPAIQRHWALTY